MLVRERKCLKMPCESCAVQFSVFKRKRACSECERYYCSGCLRRGGGTMCAPCRVLSTRPLARQTIAHLKVRDLQSFLQRQNVSTRGCVEKEELVTLCVSHVNSAAYRRRGSRSGASPFSSLKGFTNNINDFINSAFELRNPAHPAQPDNTRSNCFNSSHAHSPTNGNPPNVNNIPDRRFTPTPGGERDIRVPGAPAGAAGAGAGGVRRRSDDAGGAHVDTTDCFEIEDLDDTGWEFVTRPADPLPNDSEVLLAAAERGERGGRGERAGGTPQRAASELELRSASAASRAPSADTASLQDEPLLHDAPDAPHEPHEPHEPHAPDGGEGGGEGGAGGVGGAGGEAWEGEVSLAAVRRASQLERLSVRQLKALLARNRVEFRGCLERADLLQRARTLWRDHAKYRDEVDNLPFEESCKICMAAPLECVLLECGHIAACTACARQLAECPICRQYVVRAVRCFRS